MGMNKIHKGFNFFHFDLCPLTTMNIYLLTTMNIYLSQAITYERCLLITHNPMPSDLTSFSCFI